MKRQWSLSFVLHNLQEGKSSDSEFYAQDSDDESHWFEFV